MKNWDPTPLAMRSSTYLYQLFLLIFPLIFNLLTAAVNLEYDY